MKINLVSSQHSQDIHIDLKVTRKHVRTVKPPKRTHDLILMRFTHILFMR